MVPQPQAVPHARAATRATSDEQVIRMWLHGKAAITVRCYRRDLRHFFAYCPRPLGAIRLEDVQSFADSVTGVSDATKGRRLAALKSLLTFAHEIGYIRFNPGRPVRLPNTKDTLAERILTEAEVRRMIDLEPHPKRQVLLQFLYATGVRVAEVCSLRWRDLQPRTDAGQVTVFGKGRKTRHILLTPRIWQAVLALRDGVGPDDPVFTNGAGAPLTSGRVRYYVRRAARRAGIAKNVSPHWFRHAHASHALDRGAPVHLVKDGLGHASLATTSRYSHARPGDGSGRYLAV